MARFLVRQATPGDADAIAEIHIAARREAMPWLPVLHTDAETREWVAKVVLPGQEVWVAEVDGQVVGYAALDGQVVGYAALDGSDLNDLYVRPGYQGRGAGTALLYTAMERRPCGLSLWTFQRNAGARRFYEQYGFEAVEFTDGAANEEREPDVRYRWSGDPEPAS